MRHICSFRSIQYGTIVSYRKIGYALFNNTAPPDGAERGSMTMLKKWDKIWLNVLYLLGLGLLMILIGFGQDWPQRFKLIWAVAIILPIHACEEWQLPGGFHYQYNLTMGSKLPNKYPMSRLTDMVTIVVAEIIYLGCLFFYQQTWILMALCGFSLLEVGAHTYFGIAMYHRFKNHGKKTIYNPGMASAYLGFGSLVALMIQNIHHTGATGMDWLLTLIMLLLMALIEVILPERIFRSPQTEFGFTSPMYFAKFLK